MAFFPEPHLCPAISWLPEQLFSSRCDRLHKQFAIAASLILSHDAELASFSVQESANIPAEPFNGSARPELSDLLTRIISAHPKPHIHSCANTQFADRCQRLSKGLILRRAIYYPCLIADTAYTFLGLIGADSDVRFTEDLERAIHEIVFTAHTIHRLKQAMTRLKGTEIFMKEIGHDLASSVQTIVAKLRLISEKRVQDVGACNKAKEAEAEIKVAWRIADSLGIVGDPSYSISNPTEFNLVQVIEMAVDQYASEAAEKHIKLNFRGGVPTIMLWGEDKAIAIAVGHLLSNAIKYSFGGGEIRIGIFADSDEAVINIMNKGVPLPPDPERKLIWDFGVRGEKAKELHVNGSGIGLYTVRKVVLAHGGRVIAEEMPQNITKFTVFLPYPESLKKRLGVLL